MFSFQRELEMARAWLRRDRTAAAAGLSYASEFMSSARKSVRLPGPFTMRNGGVLPQVDVVYETWGRLSPRKDNVVLLVTGLSPGAHARSSAGVACRTTITLSLETAPRRSTARRAR